MTEPESILKTIIGEKTFYFCNDNIVEYASKSAVFSKDFEEEVKELDERFLMKFHLQRSDFERWITSVLKDEDVTTQMKELRQTVLPPHSIQECSVHQTLSPRICTKQEMDHQFKEL